jgi:hypothetical protein
MTEEYHITMSIDLATLKRELAALAGPATVVVPKAKANASKAKAKASAPKPRNAPKFNAWNDFVLATQKDMALVFGIVYDSFPTHSAFIKAASEKGCGRVAAMKEASRRREEATGEEAFVKKRAKAWAAYVEANPLVEEATTYRQRQLNRLRTQMLEDGDIVLPVAPAPKAPKAPKAPNAPKAPKAPKAPEAEAPKAAPEAPPKAPEAPKAEAKPTHSLKGITVNGCEYWLNTLTDEAFYNDSGNVGERAGLYDKETEEIDDTY